MSPDSTRLMPGVAVEDEEEDDAGFEARRRQGMVRLKRPAFCQRQMSSRSSRVCVSLRTAVAHVSVMNKRLIWLGE
jgi:hypothetical protein